MSSHNRMKCWRVNLIRKIPRGEWCDTNPRPQSKSLTRWPLNPTNSDDTCACRTHLERQRRVSKVLGLGQRGVSEGQSWWTIDFHWQKSPGTYTTNPTGSRGKRRGGKIFHHQSINPPWWRLSWRKVIDCHDTLQQREQEAHHRWFGSGSYCHFHLCHLVVAFSRHK